MLSIRDFEPDKADLLEKYTAAEARELQKKGWLSEVGTLWSAASLLTDRNDGHPCDWVWLIDVCSWY